MPKTLDLTEQKLNNVLNPYFANFVVFSSSTLHHLRLQHCSTLQQWREKKGEIFLFLSFFILHDSGNYIRYPNYRARDYADAAFKTVKKPRRDLICVNEKRGWAEGWRDESSGSSRLARGCFPLDAPLNVLNSCLREDSCKQAMHYAAQTGLPLNFANATTSSQRVAPD